MPTAANCMRLLAFQCPLPGVPPSAAPRPARPRGTEGVLVHRTGIENGQPLNGTPTTHTIIQSIQRGAAPQARASPLLTNLPTDTTYVKVVPRSSTQMASHLRWISAGSPLNLRWISAESPTVQQNLSEANPGGRRTCHLSTCCPHCCPPWSGAAWTTSSCTR